DLSLVRAALFQLSYPPGFPSIGFVVRVDSITGLGGDCDGTDRWQRLGVGYSRSLSGTFRARARRRTMSRDGFFRSPASSIARDGGVMLSRSASCCWVSPRFSRSRRIVLPSSSGVTGEVSPSTAIVRQARERTTLGPG